jgi:uncharacterized membrane protein (DUF4010 family)
MFNLWLLGQLLLTLALWILLGMEREQTYKKYQKITFAWVRTFWLIAILWFMSGMLANIFSDFWAVGVMLIVVSLFVILSSYVSQKENKTFGITTEIGSLICFLLGSLIAFDYELIAIAIAIVTFALFSFREQLHAIVHTISTEEIYDAIKFAIIAFIVLPLLPDQDYGFLGIFNPYKTWLMVVFVSWIGFIWYVLTRIIGTKKWIGLTWLIGGIVSSTAVTTSLSGLSQKAKNFSPFVFGVLISSSIMFVRVWLYAYALNKDLFMRLVIPLWVMSLAGLIISWRFYFRKWVEEKSAKNVQIKVESPFSLKPAILFGLFFAFIIAIAKLALHYLPAESLYFVAFFSWFTDVDAITLSVASLKDISLNTATITIIIAVIVNTWVKWGIAYVFGHKTFAKYIIISIAFIILAGVWSLLFL